MLEATREKIQVIWKGETARLTEYFSSLTVYEIVTQQVDNAL